MLEKLSGESNEVRRIGDNGGISDSKLESLQNGKATTVNSVEIKIVRTGRKGFREAF